MKGGAQPSWSVFHQGAQLSLTVVLSFLQVFKVVTFLSLTNCIFSPSALMVLGEACCIGGTGLIKVQEVFALRRLGVEQPR